MLMPMLSGLVLSLGLSAGGVLAIPSHKMEARDDVQTAHLKFRAVSSPETYELTVQADGNAVHTGAWPLYT